MTLERLLFWLPVLAAVLGLLVAVARRLPAGNPAWRLVALVLGTAAASGVLAPDGAPWVTGGVFLFAVVIPGRLAGWRDRAVRRQDHVRAARVGALLEVISPHLRNPARTGQQRLFSALALAVRGRMTEADAALAGLREDPAIPGPVRFNATAWLCRLRDDWSLLPPGLGEAPDAGPAEIIYRLRALQEAGARAELVRLYADARDLLGGLRWHGALFVMAACGEAAVVELLLTGPLAELPPPRRAYWRAVTAIAAGSLEAGRAELARLADGPDRLLALDAAQRLAAGAPDALDPEGRALLASEVAALTAAPPLPPASLGRAPVTLTLIGLNLAAYAVEMLSGGAEDSETLFRLGALWPDAVLSGGEWWRLGTALFLHAGPVHLGLNMVALAVLGTRTEVVSGPLATLWIFAAAGLASTGGVLLLAAQGWTAPYLLLGASGAIMGLLGGGLIEWARDWRQHRGAALQGLLGLAMLVVLQVGFDLVTPEVSMAAHLFGFAGGAVAALLCAAAGAGRAPRGPALLRSRQGR